MPSQQLNQLIQSTAFLDQVLEAFQPNKWLIALLNKATSDATVETHMLASTM
jgi:hypothetical protein